MPHSPIQIFTPVALCVFAMLSLLTLQETASGQTSKTLKHNIQFKVYTWFDESKSEEHQATLETLYYPKGKKMLPLKLTASNLSDEYQITVASNIVFYKKHTDQKGELTYNPAAKAKVAPTAKKVFIYLFPSKTQIKMLVLDTTLAHFPINHFLFANTTNNRLQVKINKQTYLVKPKSQKLLAYQLSKKETIRINVKDHQSPQKKNLAVMTVGGREKQRVIAFFYKLKGGQHRLLLERGVDDQSIKFTSP